MQKLTDTTSASTRSAQATGIRAVPRAANSATRTSPPPTAARSELHVETIAAGAEAVNLIVQPLFFNPTRRTRGGPHRGVR